MTLSDVLTKPPDKWGPSPKKASKQPSKTVQRKQARLGPWVEREAWRVVPPLVAGATAVGLVGQAPDAAVVGGRWVGDLTATTARALRVAYEAHATPSIALPLSPDWPAFNWPAVGLTAGAAIALGVTWRHYAEVDSGDGWWALAARRGHRLRVLAAFRQRWEATCARLGLVDEKDRPLRIRGAHRNDPGLSWSGNTATVRVDLGGIDPARLERAAATKLGQGLGLGRPFGFPEQVLVTLPPKDRSRYRIVKVLYRGLAGPAFLDPDLEPAPSDHELRLGWTGIDGWDMWDLNQQAHLSIRGASGKGKGRLLRRLIMQALGAGWPVAIIDGQGSPEHRQWTALPSVMYHRFRPSDLDPSYEAFIAQMKDLFRLSEHRLDLLDKLGVESWADACVKDPTFSIANPRCLAVFDEMSALFSKTGNRELDALIKELGSLLGAALRTWRKVGVNIALCDQVSFQNLLISSGSLTQAERFVAFGVMPERYRRMLAGSPKFPEIPNEYGYAVSGVSGDETTFRPIVVPSVTSAHVRATVKRLSSVKP